MRRFVLLILTLPIFVFAQDKEKENRWKPLDYFIGSWIGNEGESSEKGKGNRVYDFVLNDQFIHFKNKSIFEPTEKKPQGEVHEDWGFFSIDKNRNTYVLRQFYTEGFVNQFILDSLSNDGKTLIFITESIENGPPGMKARYVFQINDENHFNEKFEILVKDGSYRCFIENNWKRKE